MNEKEEPALSGYLDKNGTEFILETNDLTNSVKLSLDPKALASLATHFLLLANESAVTQKQTPDFKEIDKINPDCVPANGFSLTETTDPNAMGLKIIVGTQVIAFSIPKNRLEKLGQSLIDSGRKMSKA